MFTVLLVIHLLVAVALIVLVLLQHGKGADMGAAFGSGASSTVFGARGSANFLSRTTAFLAAGFFITSISLAMMAGQGSGPSSVTDVIPEEAVEAPRAPLDAPAVPESADEPVAPAPANE